MRITSQERRKLARPGNSPATPAGIRPATVAGGPSTVTVGGLELGTQVGEAATAARGKRDLRQMELTACPAGWPLDEGDQLECEEAGVSGGDLAPSLILGPS